MADKLKKSSIVNGQSAVATFDREGLNVATKPISELIHIVFGSGTSHSFNMSAVGYPLQLLTLFANDDNVSNEYVVTVNDGTVDLYKFSLTKDELPYSFPANVIAKSWVISVNVTNAVSGLGIVGQQCWLLDEFSF